MIRAIAETFISWSIMSNFILGAFKMMGVW